VAHGSPSSPFGGAQDFEERESDQVTHGSKREQPPAPPPAQPTTATAFAVVTDPLATRTASLVACLSQPHRFAR